MIILDNFLNKNLHNIIKEELLGRNFPWFFSDVKVNNFTPYDFQFGHMFFDSASYSRSNFFELILPVVQKIDPLALIRVKANITTITREHVAYGMHTDVLGNYQNLFTAVYYINTTNGYTLFETGEKVEGKENRIVIFPSHNKHSAVSSTDTNVRCVININFIGKENTGD